MTVRVVERVRGSWFDKLTMRERGDATIIAEITDQKGSRSHKLQIITVANHKGCGSKRLQRRGCRT